MLMMLMLCNSLVNLTLTTHFKGNICKFIHYPFSQPYGSSVMHKTMQTQVSSFSESSHHRSEWRTNGIGQTSLS